MDRVINIKVGGYHLTKDNNVAGVRGEGNVANLRITFDESWDKFAKTVTFYDAQGNNPVKRIQGVDLIEDITTDARTYLTPIPPEPMAIAGDLTFVIDGYYEGTRQRSISDELIVKDAPITDNANEPTDITPTQAEQLQGQIDYIKGNIQEAVIAKEGAEEARNKAEQSEKNALRYAEESAADADEAEAQANNAKVYSENAEEYANKAEEAISHNPVIVDGYWHIWNATIEEYINTGIKAQAGSEVYMGDNPPDSADVWIDPNGESALYAPYIGGNGNWYTFNPETQTFTDSGHKATPKDGYTPQKGIDYTDGKDGEDGISCTHSWNGTTLTVNSASGSSSADLKGEKGDRGDTGEAGYTPQRGIDYWTDEDKAEISDEVCNLVSPPPITTIPTTLTSNQQYNFGEVTELALAFPTVANDGDVIYATFITGETVTTLTIDTTNTCDIEFIPEANTGYEIFGKYNGSIWIVNYSEYTVSEG